MSVAATTSPVDSASVEIARTVYNVPAFAPGLCTSTVSGPPVSEHTRTHARWLPIPESGSTTALVLLTYGEVIAAAGSAGLDPHPDSANATIAAMNPDMTIRRALM